VETARHKTKGRSWKRWAGRAAGALVVLLLLIQLIPYGRDHANPPVVNQAKITSAEGQQLWDRACADCHSNLTRWPWYSNIAPLSWRIQSHVDEGRTKLNLSEWQTMSQPDLGEIKDKINSGEMPAWDYALIHGGLSASEKKTLIDALSATFANDPPASIKSGG